MGRKDILKVECDPDTISLDAVALIEPNTTVNIIKGGVIVEKKKMDMPKEVYGVLKCHNPRCISSIEQELPAGTAAYLLPGRFQAQDLSLQILRGEIFRRRAREMVPLSNEVQN